MAKSELNTTQPPVIVRAAALGYCAGVRRALDLAWQARRDYPDREIFTYGPLIHNEAVLKSLEAAGIQEWDENTVGAIIIIRAHGVTPEVVSDLESRSFTVIDATCPRVRRNQEMAARLAREGRRVIIAGDKDHGEVAGLRGYVRAGERELSEIKKRLKVIKAIIPKAFSLSKGLSVEQVKGVVNAFNASCVTNSLGEVTKLSNAAASKILNHKGFDTTSIFTHIDELFRTAVFAYEEGQRKDYFRPDGTRHKDHPNFIGYKNFVNKFEVKETEKKYYIRFTVQEEVPSKKHPELPHNVLHSAFVSDIEKYDMDSPPISVIIKAAVEPPTPYDARLAQFFKSVKPSGVALVGQSTMSGAEYRETAEKLRAELSEQPLIVADTVCPEAEKRQDAVRELCGTRGEQRVDGMLVVGGKSSANTRRLFELAKMSGADAELIQGADDIPERFYRMGRVGLSAGASTPDEVVDAVEKALQAGDFHSK